MNNREKKMREILERLCCKSYGLPYKENQLDEIDYELIDQALKELLEIENEEIERLKEALTFKLDKEDQDKELTRIKGITVEEWKQFFKSQDLKLDAFYNDGVGSGTVYHKIAQAIKKKIDGK